MVFRAELITLTNASGHFRILMSPLCLQSPNPLAEIKSGVMDKMHLYRYWMSEAYVAGLYEGYLPAGYKVDEAVMLYGDDIQDYYLGYLHVDIDKQSYHLPEGQTENDELLKLAGEAFYSAEKMSEQVAVMKATKPSDIKVSEL